MKKIILLTLYLFIIASFCACQTTPSDNTVTSKADGSFDVSNIKPSESNYNTPTLIDIQESFESTDKSVIYHFNINSELLSKNAPIIQVSPHTLSTQDAKNIANVLFPDSDFYEYSPTDQFTKSELQQSISLWASYLDDKKLRSFFGDNMNSREIENWKSVIEGFITKYTVLIPTAPENIEKSLCNWTFFPSSHYSNIKASSTEKDNLQIAATTEVNNIPYNIMFYTRDEADYKLNYVHAYIHPKISPGNIQMYAIYNSLCASDTPTDEQLSEIKKKTTLLLEEMGLGQWTVDECYYQTRGQDINNSYIIYVNATPKLSDLDVIRYPQLTNLKSTETYASNYYYTDANFEFAPNGTLLSCKITSPIDTDQIIEKNCQILDFDKIIEIAKSNLSLYCFDSYTQQIPNNTNYVFNCSVNISEVKYGLTRVKVPNTKNSYYYIPSVLFQGNYQVYEKESQTLWFDSYSWFGTPQNLLVINAVDGSIINVTNGY